MLCARNPDIEATVLRAQAISPHATSNSKDLGWMHDHTNGPFYDSYNPYSFPGISGKQTLQFIYPTRFADQVRGQDRELLGEIPCGVMTLTDEMSSKSCSQCVGKRNLCSRVLPRSSAGCRTARLHINTCAHSSFAQVQTTNCSFFF
jgi:hypothetical protein